jgi:hypothetical protein
MGIRESDVINHLRFKQTMTAPSDCSAILKDGTRLEVLMYKNRPVVEIENQFFHAQDVPGFDRFELKPVAAKATLLQTHEIFAVRQFGRRFSTPAAPKYMRRAKN